MIQPSLLALPDLLRRVRPDTLTLALTAAWLVLTAPRTSRAQGQGFGEMFSKAATNLEEGLPLINVLLAIVGAILAAFSLTGLVRAIRSPQQGGVAGPIFGIVAGAALISLPWLFGEIIEGFGGTGSGGVGFSKPAFN